MSVLVLEIFAPMTPVLWGWSWGSAVPSMCSSGCQGTGDMTGWQMEAAVSPYSSYNAAGRGTWSCLDFGEVCTCQGSCHPTLGSLPALPLGTATTQSPLGCPSAHPRARQSLLHGSCGALAELGPGWLWAGPATRVHCHCPHPRAPSCPCMCVTRCPRGALALRWK